MKRFPRCEDLGQFAGNDWVHHLRFIFLRQHNLLMTFRSNGELRS